MDTCRSTVLDLVVLAAVSLLSCSVFQYASGQSTCGTVGTNSPQLFEASRSAKFYLNVGEPAPCRGRISSFTYCYYRPGGTINSNDNYISNFAFYRENSQTDTYDIISPVYVIERSLGATLFSCADYTPNEPFIVEAGDIVGACVFNPSGGSNEQLDIVGNRLTSLGILMRTGDNGCDINAVPSSINSASLEDSSTLALHLYANFIVPVTGTQPPLATTAATTMENVPATTAATTAENVPATTAATTTENVPATTTDDTVTPTEVTMATDITTAAATTNTPVTTITDSNTPTTDPATDSEQTSLAATLLDTTTVDHSSDAGSGPVGVSAGTIVPVVVVVLTVLLVSVAIIVVIIVLWTRKQRLTKKSYPVATAAIDNILYGITEDSIAANKQTVSGQPCEYEEIPLTHNQTHEVESQEHTYECSFSDSGRVNENAYAEVGPFDAKNTKEASVYSSPLDAPVISYTALLEKNKEEDIYGRENPYQVPATREDEIYFQLKSWGVQRVGVKDVDVVGHLGSGQFGSVEQGLWKRHGTKPVGVALKSLNKKGSEDKLKFLQEAAIMAQFRHPNVIMLHGVVTQGDPMMLVVEFAMKGDLRTFLLSMRPDPGELVPNNTSSMLLSFSQQVALGMQYLSAKGFVHRDLAARNVLVSDDNICKVADFGMSRDLADENYYVSQGRDKIPVKWTAPEAIHYKKYSTASDVWAYGCLLYEIWSVGYKPFERTPNISAVRLVDSGERLPPPPGCSRMIYELMILCWHPETALRPAFRDIVLTLVGSEQMVLNIPEEDSSTNPLAGVLGAPLEAGENMYTNLQKRYIDYRLGETDQDYFEID